MSLGDSRQAEPRPAPYLQAGRVTQSRPKKNPGFREHSPGLGRRVRWKIVEPVPLPPR